MYSIIDVRKSIVLNNSIDSIEEFHFIIKNYVNKMYDFFVIYNMEDITKNGIYLYLNETEAKLYYAYETVKFEYYRYNINRNIKELKEWVLYENHYNIGYNSDSDSDSDTISDVELNEVFDKFYTKFIKLEKELEQDSNDSVGSSQDESHIEPYMQELVSDCSNSAKPN